MMLKKINYVMAVEKIVDIVTVVKMVVLVKDGCGVIDGLTQNIMVVFIGKYLIKDIERI